MNEKKLGLLLVSLTCVFFMAACSDNANISEAKKWKDVDIMFETRPPILEPGMMEFLVIANHDGRKPADDLLISLRIGETGRWSQAIQDGLTGVYRRAVMVRNPENQRIYIHIKRDKEEGVLDFPLTNPSP